MTWTANKPTAPGWYWVWTPDEQAPCHGDVKMVEVEAEVWRDGLLVVWFPHSECPERLDEWPAALWQGPIEAPAAPEASR